MGATSAASASAQVAGSGSAQNRGDGSGDGIGAGPGSDDGDGAGSIRSQASSFRAAALSRPQRKQEAMLRYRMFTDAAYTPDTLTALLGEGATYEMRDELQDVAVDMLMSRNDDSHMERQLRDLLGSVQSFSEAWKERHGLAATEVSIFQAHPVGASSQKGWDQLKRDVFSAQACIAEYEETTSAASLSLFRHIEAELNLILSSIQARALTDVNFDAEMHDLWERDEYAAAAARATNTLRDWLAQAKSFQLQANKLISSVEGAMLRGAAAGSSRAARITFAAGAGDATLATTAVSGVDPGREDCFIKVRPAICAQYEQPAGAPLMTGPSRQL